MGLCFAPDCDHTNKSGCKMFTFPKDVKLQQKWEQLIRRGDRKANKFSLICSCHFKDGDKNNLPSVFKRNIDKRFTFPSPEKKRRNVFVREKQPTKEVLKEETPSLTLFPNGPSTSHKSRPCSSTNTNQNGSISVIDERGASRCSVVSSTSSVEAENYFLKQEVESLKNQLKKLSVVFSFTHIENNDRLIMLYTGLPDKMVFDSVFNYLSAQQFRYYLDWSVVNINKKDQLLITLMKLRQNLLYEDLAFRFGCSVGTITNIVITWLHLLHVCLYKKFMRNNVPSREKNRTCLPGAFASFTNCRMIIDCTEVYTAVPSKLDKQQYTYSNYKHRNTLKGLVGVAPNGTVTFLSDLYVGNTSDKRIVQHCGILSHFKAGDLILADKGFLISDSLPPGVSLNIPPFLMKKQFSPEEVKQTLVIAKSRIHVERAIARIKKFKILSYIPASLRPYASIVFQVCGFLTTLNYPLIKEVAALYEEYE